MIIVCTTAAEFREIQATLLAQGKSSTATTILVEPKNEIPRRHLQAELDLSEGRITKNCTTRILPKTTLEKNKRIREAYESTPPYAREAYDRSVKFGLSREATENEIIKSSIGKARGGRILSGTAANYFTTIRSYREMMKSLVA